MFFSKALMRTEQNRIDRNLKPVLWIKFKCQKSSRYLYICICLFSRDVDSLWLDDKYILIEVGYHCFITKSNVRPIQFTWACLMNICLSRWKQLRSYYPCLKLISPHFNGRNRDTCYHNMCVFTGRVWHLRKHL